MVFIGKGGDCHGPEYGPRNDKIQVEVPVIDSRQKAVSIAKAASDKKAVDLVVLDVRELTTIADYFVICSGATTRQAKAISDEVDFRLGAERIFPHHVEGLAESRWVLMDYSDVVVHVFEEETRQYYDLDGLWGFAPLVEY